LILEVDMAKKDLSKRVITAAVCFAVIIPIFIFSSEVPLILTCLIGAMALIANNEICGCVGVRKSLYMILPTYLVTAASVALAILYVLTDKLSFKTFAMILFGMLFLYLFFMLASAMLSNGGVRFTQVSEVIAATLYIIVGFVSMIFLRYTGEVGGYNFMLIFMGVWFTDSAAYFIGRAFGKKKLIEDVSPNKTVAGAVGGLFGGVLGYVIYALILQLAFGVKVNYIYLVVLALIVSVVGQIGDLIASFIKREHNIKDYGKLFPGHGGVMDRLDSALAVAPVILFLLYFTKFAVFSL